MKYIYHACIQFVKTDSGVQITNWNTLVTTDKKIVSSDHYNQLKQILWDDAGKDIHSSYKKENMCIMSLSFLHEVVPSQYSDEATI